MKVGCSDDSAGIGGEEVAVSIQATVITTASRSQDEQSPATPLQSPITEPAERKRDYPPDVNGQSAHVVAATTHSISRL